MNSVIAGERRIGSRGWEGIARAGKRNPVVAEGDCILVCIFYVVGFFLHEKKRQLMCPGHMLMMGPADS